MSLVSRAMVLESLLEEKSLQRDIKKLLKKAEQEGDQRRVDYFQKEIARSILRHEKFKARLQEIDDEAKRRRR